MIYTNELPSNLLLTETVQRLSQLGCAVTADRKAARAKQRSSRAGNTAGRSLGNAPAATLAYGKAASL